MPQKLLEKCCVRVQIKNAEGEKQSHGTGVIVKDGDDYYVLTADHCIYGDDHALKEVSMDDIWIEKQLHYNSDFERIEVLEIIDSNQYDDWVLIRIADPCMDCDFLRIFRGKNFIAEEKVVFRGYQAFNENESRVWDAKIIDIAPNEFKITLTSKTFDQGGEEGALLAKGLSGSGVFMIRRDKIYLIGHLKSVIGDKALNDDMKCCNCSHINHPINNESIDLGDIDELDIWAKATKLELTDKDVEKWANEHIEYFDNINRKSKIIYQPEQKAAEIARERILDYIQQEYMNDSISGFSDLILNYTKTAQAFEKSVKSEYSRNVQSAAEAKDLIIELERNFKEHIKELINDKSNTRTIELARHKVTFWLLNCSLEFK